MYLPTNPAWRTLAGEPNIMLTPVSCSTEANVALDQEIERAQRLVRTDAYPMSIGEIVSMYEAGELVIKPPFQRLFRWDIHQKSKLIESIYLGIPIPPIFVFETAEGQWELIDGLQRISTILEVMGLLRDEETGELRNPSFLEGTRYMPSLKNVVWQKNDLIKEVPIDDQVELSKTQQFFFRRAKLNVQILKRPSDAHTKYDLFQRLNRGGTQANAQEVRNCVVIMVDSDFFDLMRNLSEMYEFKQVSRVTQKGEQTQRPLEIVMRFFVLTEYDYDGELDVEEFIDNSIIKLAETEPQFERLRTYFEGTFRLLHSALGEDALRRFDSETESFGGRVGQVALESIAVGVSRNLGFIHLLPDEKQFVTRRVQAFWEQQEVNNFSASGLRGTQRLKQTVRFGEIWFKP